MTIDAFFAGLLSALIFIVVMFIINRVLLMYFKRGISILLLFIISLNILYFIPPPIVYLAEISVITISDSGHAGFRFMIMYFITSIIGVITISVIGKK